MFEFTGPLAVRGCLPDGEGRRRMKGDEGEDAQQSSFDVARKMARNVETVIFQLHRFNVIYHRQPERRDSEGGK